MALTAKQHQSCRQTSGGTDQASQQASGLISGKRRADREAPALALLCYWAAGLLCLLDRNCHTWTFNRSARKIINSIYIYEGNQ